MTPPIARDSAAGTSLAVGGHDKVSRLCHAALAVKLLGPDRHPRQGFDVWAETPKIMATVRIAGLLDCWRRSMRIPTEPVGTIPRPLSLIQTVNAQSDRMDASLTQESAT
jgi:hypothetical protein